MTLGKYASTFVAAAVAAGLAGLLSADSGAGPKRPEAPLVGPVRSINLRLEMKEFADDLKNSRSYREEVLDKALAPFKTTAPVPGNSFEALERMGKALAEVDAEFRAGWTELHAKKYDDAIRIWKDLLNPARDEQSYKMALTRYFLGEAYRLAGKREEAIFEYRSLAIKLPSFFSPAAMGRYQAGKCFEDWQRLIRATEEYAVFVEKYSTADAKLVAELEAKLKEWRKLYSSLSGIIDNAAGRMKEVKGDLIEQLASGKPVQEKQNKIVGLLDDLILTLEEKQKEKDGGGGGGGGGGSGDGSGSGPASGVGMPSSPATQSALPEGATGKADIKTAVKVTGGDEWGRLPPRERERILNALKEQFPDRYHEIVKEYLKSLNAGGTPEPKR